MRVLVACEFSGVVRRAFRERGHDAWSCDLLPAEDDSRHHYRCSIFTIADNYQMAKAFDLMICHWPCTRLCNSGVRWLFGGKGQVREPHRWQQMEEDARSFKALLNFPVEKIACENPIPHKHAMEIIETPYTQIIQPWQFGHGETKATCLWLKNLPKLQPTTIVSGRAARVHLASPGPDRWKERSRTLGGIAKAMAEQWG